MPEFHLSLDAGGFSDLPWDKPLDLWAANCRHVVELPRGISRHPVVFVNLVGLLYALKYLPNGIGFQEHKILKQAEELRLPAVQPLGVVVLDQGGEILVTRYLERSLPYRSLFMSAALDRYREHLINAMANLLVQLHHSGYFWGDCSLSNTLYRRDAGILQAYFVDAEGSEIHPAPLSPAFRQYDLLQMEKNVQEDIEEVMEVHPMAEAFSYYDTGSLIRLRYQALWEVVTRDDSIPVTDQYRIQERIRKLNGLGFSVRSVEVQPSSTGGTVHLKISVTDRSYHRDQLFELTGLHAEEMQARVIINEINEICALLSWERGETVLLPVAGYHWFAHIYKPIMERLMPLIERRLQNQVEADPILVTDPVELYCQVLEHKWFLSERLHYDVGHQVALQDYLQLFGQ